MDRKAFIVAFCLALFLSVAGHWPAEYSFLSPVAAADSSDRADRNTSAAAKLGAVISKVVDGDPLESLAPGVFSGKLVYAFNVAGAIPRHYLVLRRTTEPAGAANNKESAVVTYPIEGIGDSVVFEPQLSPDGHYVLFKVGLTGSQDTFHLYVLDTQLHQIKLASTRALTYRRVVWSPDSRYLAYVAGGDWQGDAAADGEGDSGQPLRLLINDWRDSRERLIVRNDGVRGSFVWGAPHTLYYGALPPEPKAHPSTDKTGAVAEVPAVAKQEVPTRQRPNVYVASAEDATSKLLMMDAYKPNPSPNGEWIAFYGMEKPRAPWPLRDSWRTVPYYVALSTMKSDGTQRTAINVETHAYPQLFWKSDNRNVVAFKYVQPTPKELRREYSEPILFAQVEIRIWDTSSGRFTRVATLRSKHFNLAIANDDDFQISPLGLSRDDGHLFVAVSTVSPEEGFAREIAPVGDVGMYAINLQNGSVQQLARVRGTQGIDWFNR